ARVFEGVKAESFTTDSDGTAEVLISHATGGARHPLTCRYFLDATGQASFVAQQLGCRRLDEDFRFVSLWGYFKNSRYVSTGGVVREFDQIRAHPPMTFVSRVSGWGWAWHIPLHEDTSVGMVSP